MLSDRARKDIRGTAARRSKGTLQGTRLGWAECRRRWHPELELELDRGCQTTTLLPLNRSEASVPLRASNNNLTVVGSPGLALPRVITTSEREPGGCITLGCTAHQLSPDKGFNP